MVVKRRMEVLLMVNILVGLWIISGFAAARKEPYVPALFVFGDSLGDAGNNNYIPHSTAHANFIPYGVSFFPYPTGRFTNGRTAFDFIATFLRLPFPPPYLKPEANLSTGINFASGSSGLLDSTGVVAKVIPMARQVFQFEHFSYVLRKKHPSGAEQAKSYLAKSLYCITVGGNDVNNYIANATFQNSTTPQQFVTLLLTKFDQYITRLYRGGARKFLVLDITPVGCNPATRYTSNGECLEIANQLAVAYNTAFKALVPHLNQKLNGATVIKINAYDYLINIIEHGEVYGFKDTKSACCGSGMFNVQVSCGKTTPPDLFCNDTNAHVFWDGTHPTQRVYSMLSHQIWSGNSTVIYPFNLSTLIMAGNTPGF